MKTDKENRLKLLSILNAHFSEYNSAFHLEDRQVEIVLNAMTQCQQDNAEQLRQIIIEAYLRGHINTETFYNPIAQQDQTRLTISAQEYLSTLNKQ